MEKHHKEIIFIALLELFSTEKALKYYGWNLYYEWMQSRLLQDINAVFLRNNRISTYGYILSFYFVRFFVSSKKLINN